MKIIIKNGESVETYHNAGDVVVLPKSKLVRRFNEYVWLVRWFSQSQLCAVVEAECAAHGKQAVSAPEASESSDSKESA